MLQARRRRPYARFPRFHEVMAEDSGQSVLSVLESHILPLVPGLTDALQRGIRILDVGCGRGLIILRLAELYPHSRFLGLDLSDEAIAFARGEATRRGRDNVEFIARDARSAEGRLPLDRDAAFGARHPEQLVRCAAMTARVASTLRPRQRGCNRRPAES